MGYLNHESHSDSDFAFCGIAAGAALGSVLLWVGCVCSHCPWVSRNGHGLQNPRGLLKKHLVEPELDVFSLRCFPQTWSTLG